MKKHPVPEISLYRRLPKQMKISVRYTCLNSGLVQTCDAKRYANNLVIVTLCEFGGDRFTFEIDLYSKTMRRIAPELDWLPELDDWTPRMEALITSMLFYS